MTIKTTIFTRHPRVSLAQLLFCRWRHNRLLMTSQWSGNYNVITLIVISTSLDIGFIHGDIHGRSCKNHISPIIGYLWLWWVLEIALRFMKSARIVFGFSWRPNSAEQHMLQVKDGANFLNIYEIKRYDNYFILSWFKIEFSPPKFIFTEDIRGLYQQQENDGLNNTIRTQVEQSNFKLT